MNRTADGSAARFCLCPSECSHARQHPSKRRHHHCRSGRMASSKRLARRRSRDENDRGRDLDGPRTPQRAAHHTPGGHAACRLACRPRHGTQPPGLTDLAIIQVFRQRSAPRAASGNLPDVGHLGYIVSIIAMYVPPSMLRVRKLFQTMKTGPWPFACKISGRAMPSFQ